MLTKGIEGDKKFQHQNVCLESKVFIEFLYRLVAKRFQ